MVLAIRCCDRFGASGLAFELDVSADATVARMATTVAGYEAKGFTNEVAEMKAGMDERELCSKAARAANARSRAIGRLVKEARVKQDAIDLAATQTGPPQQEYQRGEAFRAAPAKLPSAELGKKPATPERPGKNPTTPERPGRIPWNNSTFSSLTARPQSASSLNRLQTSAQLASRRRLVFR